MQATIHAVASDKNPDAQYEVTFREDGVASCACPAYQYKLGPCKHINRLRAAGKGFERQQTKVYRVEYGGASLVLVDDSDLPDALWTVVDTLGLNKALTVERLA